MKNFFKKFGEVLFLLGLAALYALYVTICAEHGFQAYPWYGILFGILSFVAMAFVLIVMDYLVDQLQKERKKNK